MPKYTKRPRTDFIVIHSAATDPAWHGDVDIDTVRKWHTDPKPRGNGWDDVGYHLYIPRNGVIQLGRPLWAMGAHVGGYNDQSIGICLEGGAKAITKIVDGRRVLDYLLPSDDFTENQWSALRIITASMVIKYPDAEVLGHRDFPGVTKACPGFDARSWWEIARPAELIGPEDG